MISRASVWCLVGESSMYWDTTLDKAFENVFCILAILRFQTKNRFCDRLNAYSTASSTTT
jgi:hypothetical protein